MRVMYVASNPEGRPSLLIEHEITKLQKLLGARSEQINTFFFPAIGVQDIKREVEIKKPDVLHISAHGEDDYIELKDNLGNLINLTAEFLPAILGQKFTPRVLYLSACNSSSLAEAASKIVPMAIGTTKPIANYFAWESAIAFYDSLAEGSSVEDAYSASSILLQTLSSKDVNTVMHVRTDVVPKKEVLFYPPRLVARFEPNEKNPGSDGNFWFEPGILGPDPDTHHAVFFTDDKTFIQTGSLENDLCWVALDLARGNARHGQIYWLNDYWKCDGDFRLFGCAVTPKGKSTTVSAQVSDALSAFYELEARNKQKAPKRHILQAIERLRENAF